MKWYTYLICLAFIISGVFCGIRLYTLVTARSYVNGSINIENRFSTESFSYRNTSVEFYRNADTDIYTYETDLLRVDDFDGQRNQYQIVLNDYILIDTQIAAGSMFSVVYLDFYDTDGKVVCSASMDIAIKFLSDKTELSLVTTGEENASYLTQYFKDNGIRLKINKITKEENL